jgi:hypothetical protein
MSDEFDRRGRNSSPPDYDFRDFEPIPKEELMISLVVIGRGVYLALPIISLYLSQGTLEERFGVPGRRVLCFVALEGETRGVGIVVRRSPKTIYSKSCSRDARKLSKQE